MYSKQYTCQSKKIVAVLKIFDASRSNSEIVSMRIFPGAPPLQAEVSTLQYRRTLNVKLSEKCMVTVYTANTLRHLITLYACSMLSLLSSIL